MTTEHNLAMAHFRSAHEAKIGYPYMPIWGKDLKLLKSITSTYGQENTIKLIDIFFETYDQIDFVQKAGVTVGVFYTQIPKMLIKLSKETKSDEVGRL